MALYSRTVMVVFALLISACGETEGELEQRRRDAQWDSSRCSDEAVLLATTSGAPSVHACSNKHHQMQFQVAPPVASNEEAAVLVVCKCIQEKP